MKGKVQDPIFMSVLLISYIAIAAALNTTTGSQSTSSAPGGSDKILEDGDIIGIAFGVAGTIGTIVALWRFVCRRNSIRQKLKTHPFMYSVVKKLNLSPGSFNSFDEGNGQKLMTFTNRILQQLEYAEADAWSTLDVAARENRRTFSETPIGKATNDAVVDAIKTCPSILLSRSNFSGCPDGNHLATNQLAPAQGYVLNHVLQFLLKRFPDAVRQVPESEEVSEPESAAPERISERPTLTAARDSRVVNNVNAKVTWMGDINGSAADQVILVTGLVEKLKPTDENDSDSEELKKDEAYDIRAEEGARVITGGRHGFLFSGNSKLTSGRKATALNTGEPKP